VKRFRIAYRNTGSTICLFDEVRLSAYWFTRIAASYFEWVLCHLQHVGVLVRFDGTKPPRLTELEQALFIAQGWSPNLVDIISAAWNCVWRQWDGIAVWINNPYMAAREVLKQFFIQVGPHVMSPHDFGVIDIRGIADPSFPRIVLGTVMHHDQMLASEGA
jgi:hypothetical protein